MADWIVEGAGSWLVNGVYSQAGTSGGKPYYVGPEPANNIWLIWGSVPGGTAWVLTDGYGYYYMGKLNSELPANPWVVWQDGNYPAPTVRAAEEEEPEPEPAPEEEPEPEPAAEFISGLPYPSFNSAYLENVVEDGTTLHCLLMASYHYDFYSVDVGTGEWTECAAPELANQYGRFATCVYNGRLYLLANDDMPGSAEYRFGLYEYDPATDSWSKVVSWDLRDAVGFEAMNLGPIHLTCGVDGKLYATGRGGWIYKNLIWLRIIDPLTWEVTSGAEIDLSGVNYGELLAAYALPDDPDFQLHVIVGNGYRYSWAGEWSAYSEPLTKGQTELNQWRVAEMPTVGRTYVGNARIAVGQARLGRCSHSMWRPFAAASIGTALYLIDYQFGGMACLFKLPTHPYQPGHIGEYLPSVLNVTVVDDDATVNWTFRDPDEPDDGQSAYRIVLSDQTGAQVADTGKTVSTAQSHLFSALTDGGYRAEVTVWDETDQASAPGSITFLVGAGAPPGDEPPTATITAPTDGATITADVQIKVTAYDDNAVASVKFMVDGQLIRTLTAPNDGANYATTWAIAGWTNGRHTITVIATDNVGQTGQDSVTVTLDAGGDTEAPMVTITAPPASGTVHGVVTVKATATDNVGVVRVNLYVDGQLQDGLTAPNDGAGYAFTWDTEGWANGPRTLRVVAYDPSGNWGYAERTVTVDRAKALSTLYLFTEQMPTAAVADRWRADLRFRRGLLTCLAREPAPADPKERYQVTVGVHVPGDSVNFADYQRIDPDRVHGFTGEGNTCRWALCAVPSFTEAFWELDAEAAFRFIVLPSGPPALLTTGDNGLWHMVGGRYALWEALTGITTLADGAYFDGQIACLGGAAFVLKDVDTGELTWQAMLPGATGYSAVAADAAGGYLLVGATTAAGAAVYRFAYQALTKIGDLPAAVTRVALAGGVGAIGCADGVAYRWAGGSAAPTLLVDTETDGIWSICDSGGVTYLGTGDLGAVWASMPAWHEDTTLGAGRVRALAVWQGALWAAGLGDGALWRMQNGVWSQWHVFGGVTVIDDLLVDAQDRLWVAATHSGGARVYRLEVAAGGDFESGPEPPDVLAKIVRAV